MTEIRQADSKGRVTIPSLANATIIVERVHDTEFRIRKAQVIPERDLEFPEDRGPLELSARDAEKFLAALENPPAPNRAAKRAAREFSKKYGPAVDDRKTRKKA